MREFIGTDELKNARIRGSDLSGAQLRGVNFSNVTITDRVALQHRHLRDDRWTEESTGSRSLHSDAELDRRHPERTRLRPTDVDGLRAALDVVDEMWAPTIERARRLPPKEVRDRVGGEYSFMETLRHLIFVTDAWLIRMVLRVPNAYHEWAVAPDLPPDVPPDTGPGLDPVLDVRADRTARLHEYLGSASEDDLSRMVSAPDPTGHPQGTHRVLDCFHVVLGEEWWHHRYATRDLAVLEGA